MKPFIVDVHKWADTNYEIGRKQLQSVTDKSSYLVLLNSLTSSEVDWEEGTSLLENFAPHLIEEIKGLGDPLNLSYQEAFRYFSGYDLPKLGALGCSSIVTPELFIRNYDFSPYIYDYKFAIKNSEKAYSTCGYTMLCTGLHEGVNEHGLAMALHYVNNHNQQKGFMSTMITRMVLDTCKNLEEAIDLFKALPHAACYNYSLGDTNGNIAIVEGSPEKVVVRRGQQAVSCTNHFLEMNEYNRKIETSTHKRKSVLEESLHSQNDLFDIFATPGKGLFYQDYDDFFGTLHTFSYDFSLRKVKTTVAQGDETLEFGLDRLTNDEPLPLSRMKGYIEEREGAKE